MTIERKRLLELALHRLNDERERVSQDLEKIQSELVSANFSRSSRTGAPKKKRRRKRRPMTTQERKAHSKRMKQYWAERKRREKQQKTENEPI